MVFDDTIFAVSSGAAPAAIAIIRVSGRAAFAVVGARCGSLPAPGRAALRPVRDRNGELIDRALILAFAGPNSASGEDLVELHVHGGRAVVRAVEAMLAGEPGLRPAAPGEFTRRALTSGRIDLTEAEALGDLLAAETEAQRKAALIVAEGGLRRLVENWSRALLELAARVELQIDHDDEDDAGALDGERDRADATALAACIGRILTTPPVERLRDGLSVVIAGAPNVGKSTLLNALAGRDAAITSPVAGTTRDRIDVPVIRSGIAYLLTDTAGLRDDHQDPVEATGIARAVDAVAEADILLWVGDTGPDPAMPRPGTMLWIYPRVDLPARRAPFGAIAVSAWSGDGIDAVWSSLDNQARRLLPPPDRIAVNRRQRDLLGIAFAALNRAAELGDPLLLAEELRHAMAAIDTITGHSNVEAMLDALFAGFCIGK